MVVGRALVDRCGVVISVLNIAALAGLAWYLRSDPASDTAGPLHALFVDDDVENAIDAMTSIVTLTTVVVWFVAIMLCITAIRKGRAGAGFAGAAALLVIAVTLLNVAGSMLRLFTASVFSVLPYGQQKVGHGGQPPEGSEIDLVLLPKADDFVEGGKDVFKTIDALRIDLIPVYFVVMVIVFGGLLWIDLWWRRCRQDAEEAAASGEETDTGRIRKASKRESKTHLLVEGLPEHLPQAVITAIIATIAAWAALTWGIHELPGWVIDDSLIVLKVLGAVAIVMIILRRPTVLAERLRRSFGSVADIAGFWAPDLHPLAGASYRRGLIAGIRQSINDLVLTYPDEPIALVGHSQGSVACAWFVRGGHWTEQPSEGMTDRQALRAGLHNVNPAPSNRIALFTVGSPLESLYATFFPRFFDTAFFETTRRMTSQSARWRNYWRKTDPIGFPIKGLPDRDNVNVTELKDHPVLGHGEYWREERLRSDISRFLNAARVQLRRA